MTTPARQAEADRVELAYYWALNRLGSAIAVDSLDLWSEVPATAQASKATWWLTQVIDLIFGYRSEASALAIAYYRLVRSLRTGFAPAHGDEADGDSVSLDKLRDEFDDILDNIERETSDVSAPTPAPYDAPEPDLESADEDDAIPVEDIGDIDELVDRLNERAGEEATTVMDQLGLNTLLKKLDEADSELEGSDMEAHEFAGNRQAAAAMRIMMNAARGLTYDLADTDARVIGWARYSPSGDPCAFCAMLISRAVLYKTKAAATAKTSDGTRRLDDDGLPFTGDEYHDNCRCIAIPIFGLDSFDSPIFQQNRDLRDLWKREIRGKYSGKDALNAWRTLLRRQRLAASASTPALEAA